MDSVKDYVEFIKAPWGKMFYDMLFLQLNIPEEPRLKILDYGSGLGVTSDSYAKWHNVTAIEPNEEMIQNSFRVNCYTQISGSLEKLIELQDSSYDLVLCHNVLEYIDDKSPIIAEFMRVLKINGILSVVKHNRYGRVFQTAIFQNNPQKAITLLDCKAKDINNYLGTQYIYSNSYIEELVVRYSGKVERILGMRTFWALGQDNSIKYTNEWYENMLDLECRVVDMDEYMQVAFFNHIFIRKD